MEAFAGLASLRELPLRRGRLVRHSSAASPSRSKAHLLTIFDHGAPQIFAAAIIASYFVGPETMTGPPSTSGGGVILHQ